MEAAPRHLFALFQQQRLAKGTVRQFTKDERNDKIGQIIPIVDDSVSNMMRILRERHVGGVAFNFHECDISSTRVLTVDGLQVLHGVYDGHDLATRHGTERVALLPEST